MQNITIVNSDLQRMLDEQRSEGVIESVGGFTVNLEQAKAKSQRFGSECPDKALLKLCQVLIGGAPSFLKMKLSSNQLEIEVDSAGRLLQDATFLKGDLGESLWSCVYSGFVSAQICVGKHSWRLTKDGVEEPEETSNPLSEQLIIRVNFEEPKGFWNSVRALVRGRNTATFALANNLRYSPIAAKLDNRLLNGGDYRRCRRTAIDIFLTGSKSTKRAEILPTAHLATKGQVVFVKDRKFRPTDLQFNSFVKISRPARASRFGLGKSWNTVKDGSLLAHLWVPESSTGKPKLILVKNGVVVGERAFPIHAVASAYGLDTDASGLAVVMNRKLEELEEYLLYSATREWTRVKDLPLPSKVLNRLKVLKR